SRKSAPWQTKPTARQPRAKRKAVVVRRYAPTPRRRPHRGGSSARVLRCCGGGGGAMPEIQAGSRSIWIRRGADALQPDQPTVVFVHGAGGSSLTWIYQIRALRKRLNCVAIDLPGHGKSADDT